MNPLIQLKETAPVFLITLTLACVAISPQARALLPAPTPDGAYPVWNTAEGSGALFSLTSGGFNTAIGGHALYGNTTGSSNTAVGAFTLAANSSGDQNVAVGQGALRYNTTGNYNTANGVNALYSNTTGNYNAANGAGALKGNTRGGGNTASGYQALYRNADGAGNTATGYQALYSSSTFPGAFNTATGFWALYLNNGGYNNTAVGSAALFQSTNGNNNVALGVDAGANIISASNVTCLGAGVRGENVDNTTWIANVYSAVPISGTTLPVIVSDTGQLGTVASSERFKKDVATMDKASEAILSLRPVTFHYRTDTKGTPQFGLIAEEVAEVNPALVLPDKEGKPYTVRYDAVNAMLLNEFLKEHSTVQELKNEVAALIATVKEQAAQIQKVSAQFELSKSTPQTAAANQ
jgi:Chaperone of endosialidase